MTDATPSPDASRPWPIIALLIAMAIGFAAHALWAVRDKSSTYDEPVHTLSSWLIVNAGDFRVNPEHPALWKYVAGLGLIGQPLAADLFSPDALSTLRQLEPQWPWTVDTLYRGPDQSPLYGEHLVMRARVAMSLFAVALALIVARWAWVWSAPAQAPWAAVIATALLMFDPTFLAHAALVTNDVAATACIALATFFAWRLGTRLTWRSLILFIASVAAGFGIKFSCLLLAPMLGVLLFIRALGGGAWPAGAAYAVRSRAARAGIVAGVGVASTVAGFAALWPTYQFRDAPTPMGLRFNDEYPHKLLAYYALLAERMDDPVLGTDAQIKADVPAYRPGLTARSMFRLGESGVVPQAWGFGLNYANARSLVRYSFLVGDYSSNGFFWFFPLCVLFKTPLTTLAIALASTIVGVAQLRQCVGDVGARWKLACLIVPPAIFFAIAIASRLNIGLRHLLPIYPPLFVACGVVLARLIARWRPARFIVPAALALLAIETTSAFPNYLPFFNAASGGARGGLALLSDSNLDWGQDLPALARWYQRWRATHPADRFYLSYYGTADPNAYGIDYLNARPGYPFARTPVVNDLDGGPTGGVYAVSASFLQGLYPPDIRPAMAELREQKPLDVVNGTIYLYKLPPTDRASATTRPAR